MYKYVISVTTLFSVYFMEARTYFNVRIPVVRNRVQKCTYKEAIPCADASHVLMRTFLKKGTRAGMDLFNILDFKAQNEVLTSKSLPYGMLSMADINGNDYQKYEACYSNLIKSVSDANTLKTMFKQYGLFLNDFYQGNLQNVLSEQTINAVLDGFFKRASDLGLSVNDLSTLLESNLSVDKKLK